MFRKPLLIPVRVVVVVSAILLLIFGLVVRQNLMTPVVSVIPTPTPSDDTYRPILQLQQGEQTVSTGIEVWETYFDFTADCRTLYYSRGEEPTAAIGKYDVASGALYKIDLPSLGDGTLYLPQISPDGKRIAWFDTHGEGERGVVVMDLLANGVSIPHFVYDSKDGWNVYDYRWFPDSQFIAVQFNLDNLPPDSYLYVRSDMQGGHEEMTKQEWDALPTITVSPTDKPHDKLFDFTSVNGVYSVSAVYGEYGTTAVTASCSAQ